MIPEITKRDKEVIIAYAENNMNASETARNIFMSRNSVVYHLDRVKKITKLNPCWFYDLVELVSQFRKENPQC